ncbi:AFL162Cp [Eremothecium gossypii ATCC 10895]|uniref:Large ribosomal subunit protein bL28m n=1 Tax=Eremothecium gossypii (strain ATCC 10895 / CBS 109.51 / FGSC 9923 / NRRL Y-1056) TaxID=284811 RepID=Q755I5_EREGS|nr:mitochondrial 54S ribosomal protein YmL24/YmL14 [Eremothecium gossypii ATCC 10895]AAS53212.1 AFL162Cp [Eremothecium gossypii ATCC 10895]AEY97522.1 FAFL162Cp [Eremothecium gossypii FDAG1]
MVLQAFTGVGLGFKRNFSSGLHLLRAWKQIEVRKLAKQPEYKVGDEKPRYIPSKRKTVPDYKYGESRIFKQSNNGLYGGSFIQFGNNISESKTKTRRTWLPNIVRKSLWSEALQKDVRIKLTAKVLRTISKEGGLDNYLTKDKSARIKELGPKGWELRYRVLVARERQLNPPHKDAQAITTEDGRTVTVYYEVPLNGTTLRITCGRRRLLFHLFNREHREHKADGLHLTFKSFLDKHRDTPVPDIVSRLVALGHSMEELTV